MWQVLLSEIKDKLPLSEAGQRETTIGRTETERSKPTKEVEELLAALYNGPEALTPQLRKAFAAHRKQVIPELIALASNGDLWLANAPGKGYVPIHAVNLLGQLRATEAVPSLIDIVSETGPGELLRDAALNALEEIGKPAVPAILETMRYSRDLRFKTALAPTLGEIGVKQPGVFEALAQLYQQTDWGKERMLAVVGLGLLRDKRAIPLLRPELRNPSLSIADRNELFYALRELGVKGEDMDEAWRMIVQRHFSSLFDKFLGLESLRSFVAALSPEQRRDATYATHYFTYIAGEQILRHVIPSLFDEPTHVMDTLAALEVQVQGLDFSEGLRTLKGATRNVAEHLAECAGPQLCRAMQGIVAALRAYVQDNYSSSWNPNQLLREVRQLQGKDPSAALAKLGQAGALVLRGKKLWPHWAIELEAPGYDWV
ncbi:MAG: HEAT repeat domain-containing protein, partial [Anaerolineae bacterium]